MRPTGDRRRIRVSALAVLVLVLATPLLAQDLRFLSVGSGDLDGGYFAASRAICGVINRAEKAQMRCSPETTSGSLYNLVALDNGQVDFAIVQSDWQKHAVAGTSIFASRGPMTRLRGVMSLYLEPFNLIARRSARIGGVLDLVGKRVDIGPPSSGRQATMRAVMEGFGITLSDFSSVSELPGSAAVTELCEGRIDATVLIVGHPNAAISRALTECDAELVSLAGPEIERLVAASNAYSRVSVPVHLYSPAHSKVLSFAVQATVVTLSTMDDEVVDMFVRNTLVHLDALRKKVPILTTLDPDAMCSIGLAAPLHPAAKRAFDKFLKRE